MAITKDFDCYEKVLLKKLGINYSGLFLCELGNQDFYDGQPAKKHYELNGVVHTSIDLNGRDGSLPLNLDNELPNTLYNKFDVITNYGTTEHVNNQYQVFKNIHDICKQNGIMIHGVPFVKNWKNHCRYYYSLTFFEQLATFCNYQIIDLQVLKKDYYKFPKNLVVSVLKKRDQNNFISKQKFDQISGIQDSKNLKNTGNYSK